MKNSDFKENLNFGNDEELIEYLTNEVKINNAILSSKSDSNFEKLKGFVQNTNRERELCLTTDRSYRHSVDRVSDLRTSRSQREIKRKKSQM